LTKLIANLRDVEQIGQPCMTKMDDRHHPMPLPSQVPGCGRRGGNRRKGSWVYVILTMRT
jgi:hypothetical protein